MARRKKVVKIPVEDWCSCPEWKEKNWCMTNQDKMSYCPLCGNKLVKEKTI
jgi:hypothetical protein